MKESILPVSNHLKHKRFNHQYLTPLKFEKIGHTPSTSDGYFLNSVRLIYAYHVEMGAQLDREERPYPKQFTTFYSMIRPTDYANYYGEGLPFSANFFHYVSLHFSLCLW